MRRPTALPIGRIQPCVLPTDVPVPEAPGTGDPVPPAAPASVFRLRQWRRKLLNDVAPPNGQPLRHDRPLHGPSSFQPRRPGVPPQPAGHRLQRQKEPRPRPRSGKTAPVVQGQAARRSPWPAPAAPPTVATSLPTPGCVPSVPGRRPIRSTAKRRSNPTKSEKPGA